MRTKWIEKYRSKYIKYIKHNKKKYEEYLERNKSLKKDFNKFFEDKLKSINDNKSTSNNIEEKITDESSEKKEINNRFSIYEKSEYEELDFSNMLFIDNKEYLYKPTSNDIEEKIIEEVDFVKEILDILNEDLFNRYKLIFYKEQYDIDN